MWTLYTPLCLAMPICAHYFRDKGRIDVATDIESSGIIDMERKFLSYMGSDLNVVCGFQVYPCL
jgi:hypothetical protein